jgi:arylsulfatase A-like enzyme
MIQNLLIGTCALALASCGSTKVSEQKPNVLIILLDDAGYNDFGFMGSRDISTPNIDKLASTGVILSDAHVSATVCGPSRAGLLTGRYQQRSGYECNPDNEEFGLCLSEKTIADVFKENGYHTYVIGKWHQGGLPKMHPNKRGFDDFYGFLSGSRSYFYNTKTDSDTNTMLQHNGEKIKFESYLTYELGDAASKFVKEKTEKPFMMYLSFNAVHTPMEATQEDLNLFEGHPRQTLAAMTYAVDKAIGNVIEALKESGKFNNTLIFFLSDNGGAHNNSSSNYPLKGFKGNKFEGGHRVPFFMVYPGFIKPDTRYNGLVSSLDIMPTSMAAAGIDMSGLTKPLDGVNILPYLTDDTVKQPHSILFWRKQDMAVVREGDFKLIRVKNEGIRLYNLKNNLQETDDLSDQFPYLVEELSTELEKWETELANPLLWDEGIWNEVTREIHHDLMNNQPVRYYTPGELKKNKILNEIIIH